MIVQDVHVITKTRYNK